MESTASSKSRLVESFGQMHWQCQLAALMRLMDAGREEVGSLMRFSCRTLSVISAAEVKMF